MGTSLWDLDGSSVYEWWSRHPAALDVLYTLAFLGREETIRQASIDTLDLGAGERVLEIGAGTGNALEPLQAAVAPDGSVHALDASEGMIRSTAERIHGRDWQRVHPVRADGCRLPFRSGTFEAAYAAMSLSAMSAPASAIEAVHDVLRPGGRFVVLDARPFTKGPATALNPIVEPVAKRTTNWKPAVDIVGHLDATFDRVTVSTYNGGSIFVARARREAVE